MPAHSPPAELYLSAGAVGRLNWQPRVCPAPMPCIASRCGDVLEVIFVTGYDDPASWRRLDGRTRYRYRLDPLSDDVVIGRRIP